MIANSYTIREGHFLVRPVGMPYETPPPGGPDTVRVIKTEEKGSDVNLATALLVDAFDGEFEQAVVVSNDSNLVEPIKIVRDKFQLPVVVLFPCGGARKPSFHLSAVASKSPIVNPAHLAASQFPANLSDAAGER